MYEIAPIYYIFRSTWIKIITDDACEYLLRVTFFIFGSGEVIFYLKPYMYFCPYFSNFFIRSGKVGAGSLHVMMMMMTMSTDELRDDRLREDCNFLLVQLQFHKKITVKNCM